MIEHVGLNKTTFAPPPLRFEAGTPAIAEAIGFGAAVDYMTGLGMARVQQQEAELSGYLYQQVVLLSDSVLLWQQVVCAPGLPAVQLCLSCLGSAHPNAIARPPARLPLLMQCSWPVKSHGACPSAKRSAVFCPVEGREWADNLWAAP